MSSMSNGFHCESSDTLLVCVHILQAVTLTEGPPTAAAGDFAEGAATAAAATAAVAMAAVATAAVVTMVVARRGIQHPGLFQGENIGAGYSAHARSRCGLCSHRTCVKNLC